VTIHHQPLQQSPDLFLPGFLDLTQTDANTPRGWHYRKTRLGGGRCAKPFLRTNAMYSWRVQSCSGCLVRDVIRFGADWYSSRVIQGRFRVPTYLSWFTHHLGLSQVAFHFLSEDHVHALDVEEQKQICLCNEEAKASTGVHSIGNPYTPSTHPYTPQDSPQMTMWIPSTKHLPRHTPHSWPMPLFYDRTLN